MSAAVRSSSGGRFLPAGHDHEVCLDDALDRAADVCRSRGVRLTTQRRRVLELVWSSHKPVGAYQLIDEMSADGSRCAPPTVYRALQFLIENGLIHRIESLNAFVGCPETGVEHAAQFLICDDCGDVAELRSEQIDRAILDGASAAGFAASRTCVEVVGLCPACRPERGTATP